ncbi:Sterol 3-beta-glucosyltransferase [Paramyrothecium foliicola]|nr:Sterol 3-beta-glucosyltransferase [Paramyrothecium foliicola]
MTPEPVPTKRLNADIEQEEEAWNAPPPYGLQATSDILESSAIINEFGSIDLSFSSHCPEQLARRVPPYFPPKQELGVPARAHGQPPSLNIVIQVVGSRGDVQPFVAYGTALQRHGHRVRLATHDKFGQFVQESGLEFYPIGGDPEDLMAYMVKNPGLIPSLESLRGGDVGRKRKMIKDMLRGCWLSCIDADPTSGKPFVADAIVANPPSFAHVHCAQALGVPLHIMFTMPWSSTRAFPHPLANIVGSDVEPAHANWLSYGVVDVMTWQGLGDVINSWRKKELKLAELPAFMGATIVNHLRVPHTYCWSPALVAKPADWRSEIDVCGFFMRDEPQYSPPSDLDAFLAAGPRPLYVGFGSIVLDQPEKLTETILEAAHRCGVRVIISKGWSGLGGDSPNTEKVFYLGDCPHEWLFKRVSAVVHHGGAGTTACGLINARPTIIVPFFGDQPFWGNVVANAGAGPRPIPQKQLTVERLVNAINYAVSSGAKDSARMIAEKMRAENGVNTAVESFYRWLPIDQMHCPILSDQPARWRIERDKKQVKLSDAAVAVLLAQKKLKLNELDHLRTKEYDTDARRWDPFTGGAAAILGTMMDFTSALGGTFVDPFKAYKEARHKGKGGSAGAAAAQGAAKGFASMAGVITKGTLVDTPLALTEGLRNAPRLYGDEVKDHGKVKDWQSGGVVAAKNFAHGFYDGVTGVVTQPYKGAKAEGALGFLKGAGRGSIGLIAKPGSAMFGLMAYPAQGIFKSLTGRKVSDPIFKAKCALVDDWASFTASGDDVVEAEGNDIGLGVNASPATTAATPIPLLTFASGNASRGFYRDDFELLHHFTTVTSSSLLDDEAADRIWRVQAPQEAFRCDFLLHGILAVAAMHLQRLRPESAAYYHRLAAQHHTEGISLFRPALDRLTQSTATPTFLFSSILVCMSLHLFETEDQAHADSMSPLDRIFDAFNLGRGVHDLLKSTWYWLLETPFTPLLHLRERMKDYLITLDDEEALARVEACVRAELAADAMLPEYLGALGYLREFYACRAVAAKHKATIVSWPVLVSEAFYEDMTRKTPLAMVILAYFGALLNELRNTWWVGKAGRRLVQACSKLVTDDHRELVSWAERRVQYSSM